MSKVKPKRPRRQWTSKPSPKPLPSGTKVTVFRSLREKLGPREVVGPAMGTNRISLYRWETGVHPMPRWAPILIELLAEKYPTGLPDWRPLAAAAGMTHVRAR